MDKPIKYYRARLSYTYELTPADVEQWELDLQPNEILKLMREDVSELTWEDLWDHIETEIVYEEENQ